MIHVRVSRNTQGEIDNLHLSVTEDSLPNFCALVDKALNCWDDAPAELKELGDMLTHGKVTQDHVKLPINSTRQSNSDYYNAEETEKIQRYIEENSVSAYLELRAAGKMSQILGNRTGISVSSSD